MSKLQQQIRSAIFKVEHQKVNTLTTNIDPNLLVLSINHAVLVPTDGHETLLHCAASYGCVSDIGVLTQIKPEMFLLKDHRGESVLRKVAVRHHAPDCMSILITEELLLSTDTLSGPSARTVLFQSGQEGWFHDLKALMPKADFASLIMRANTKEPFLITAAQEGWFQDVSFQAELYPEMLTMSDAAGQKLLQIAVSNPYMLEMIGDDFLRMTKIEMLIDPTLGHNTLFHEAARNGNIKYFSHLLNFSTLEKIFTHIALDNHSLNSLLKCCTIGEIQKFINIQEWSTFFGSNNLQLSNKVLSLVREKYTSVGKEMPTIEVQEILAQVEVGDLSFDEWDPEDNEIGLAGEGAYGF